MTRRYFETYQQDKRLTILLGYDRRLQYYFLFVQWLNAPAEEENVLYYSLRDPAAGTKVTDLQFFVEVLQTRGVVLPAYLIERLQRDKDEDIGNDDSSYHDSAALDFDVTLRTPCLPT